jgi:hypothetical protein
MRTVEGIQMREETLDQNIIDGEAQAEAHYYGIQSQNDDLSTIHSHGAKETMPIARGVFIDYLKNPGLASTE